MGINSVLAEVLPDGKSQKSNGCKPAAKSSRWWATASTMPPRWLQADVGIAMGHGTDVAMEAADITLVKGDLNGVVTSIALSKATIAQHQTKPVFRVRLQRAGHSVRRGCVLSAHGLAAQPHHRFGRNGSIVDQRCHQRAAPARLPGAKELKMGLAPSQWQVSMTISVASRCLSHFSADHSKWTQPK